VSYFGKRSILKTLTISWHYTIDIFYTKLKTKYQQVNNNYNNYDRNDASINGWLQTISLIGEKNI